MGNGDDAHMPADVGAGDGHTLDSEYHGPSVADARRRIVSFFKHHLKERG